MNLRPLVFLCFQGLQKWNIKLKWVECETSSEVIWNNSIILLEFRNVRNVRSSGRYAVNYVKYCIWKLLIEPEGNNTILKTKHNWSQVIYKIAVLSNLQCALFFNKELHHKCFPVNFAKFSSTTSFEYSSGKMVLQRSK